MCLSLEPTLNHRAAESAPLERATRRPLAAAGLSDRHQLGKPTGALNAVGKYRVLACDGREAGGSTRRAAASSA